MKRRLKTLTHRLRKVKVHSLNPLTSQVWITFYPYIDPVVHHVQYDILYCVQENHIFFICFRGRIPRFQTLNV